VVKKVVKDQVVSTAGTTGEMTAEVVAAETAEAVVVETAAVAEEDRAGYKIAEVRFEICKKIKLLKN
jgi:hypothetical protein